MKNYTGLELSKKLRDAGFKRENKLYWNKYSNAMGGNKNGYFLEKKQNRAGFIGEGIPSYNIINDLCIKYSKDVWGEAVGNDVWCDVFRRTAWVMMKIRQGKKNQAEEYILKHSILFKK